MGEWWLLRQVGGNPTSHVPSPPARRQIPRSHKRPIHGSYDGAQLENGLLFCYCLCKQTTKNGVSYPEEQFTLNRSGCLTDRFLRARFSTDGPQQSVIWEWIRHKTFSLVTISNHSLVLLPSISALTTVDFGFHILLKQPFDFPPSPLPWHC